MEDANPMRTKAARDDLRERVMDGMSSGIAKGAIRHEVVLGLLDMVDEFEAAMDAAQIGVAQCAQVQDALRRVLPMAEAWFRREFDGLCDHEPGECHCDREAHARTDINIALAALGKGAT